MLKSLSLVAGVATAASLFVLSACAEPVTDGPQAGPLVIAGGALDRETADVWTSFIEAAHGDGPMVIVPSSSGSPAGSAASARKTLLKYGVAEARIQVAKLAKRDDRDTARINEARWANNYNDPETVALLSSASAIWFTGGDQSRTTDILIKNGEATPALTAIRKASSKGAPIGGSSAGAAIMSGSMLLQGDSLTALTGSGEGEALKLGQGLGFFSYGLVDQHFGERARLGRLVAALAQEAESTKRIGFGVDENTALIVSEDGQASVGGDGYITIIDARQASFNQVEENRLKVTGLTLHLIAAGDKLDLTKLTMKPADWKRPTIGNEYVETPRPGGGGMALQGQMLAAIIGEGLVDNKGAETVDRISFDSRGRGVAYAFTQLPQSAGFWGRGPDGKGRYAIANVRFDIIPVNLTMETVQ